MEERSELRRREREYRARGLEPEDGEDEDEETFPYRDAARRALERQQVRVRRWEAKVAEARAAVRGTEAERTTSARRADPTLSSWRMGASARRGDADKGAADAADGDGGDGPSEGPDLSFRGGDPQKVVDGLLRSFLRTLRVPVRESPDLPGDDGTSCGYRHLVDLHELPHVL